MAKAIIIAAGFVVAALLVGGRFQGVAAGGGSGVYVLDRLTGSVEYCAPRICVAPAAGRQE